MQSQQAVRHSCLMMGVMSAHEEAAQSTVGDIDPCRTCSMASSILISFIIKPCNTYIANQPPYSSIHPPSLPVCEHDAVYI